LVINHRHTILIASAQKAFASGRKQTTALLDNVFED
jgi:hypothetical protein